MSSQKELEKRLAGNASDKPLDYEAFKKAYQKLKDRADSDPEAGRIVKQCYKEICPASSQILPPGVEHTTITKEVYQTYLARKKEEEALKTISSNSKFDSP